MPVDIADPFSTEVVEMILQYAARIDTPTCLTVCLTNKNLSKRIGMPELYRNVEIIGANLEEYTCKGGFERSRKWSSVCRTLLNNRDLAKLVRSLNVCLDDDTSIGLNRPEFEDAEPFRNLVNKELSMTPTQREQVFSWYDREVEHWCDCCELQELCKHSMTHLSMEGYLCLFMLACPNLITLRLSGHLWSMKSADSLAEALRDASQSNTSIEPSINVFQSLQEVILSSEHNGTTSTQFVHSLLFYWPGLKKLTVEGLYHEHPNIHHNPAHRPSSIQELHIQWVKEEEMDSNYLTILHRCPQLRTLTLEFGDDCDIYNTFQWDELGATLQGSNKMLEELRIEASYRCISRDFPMMIPDHDEINYDRLSGLKKLRRLRKLTAPTLVLFGTLDTWILADVLPSSAEEVELLCRSMDSNTTERLLMRRSDDFGDIKLLNRMRDREILNRHSEGSKTMAPSNR